MMQGNNTTFPTDAKLYKKNIDRCNTIARNRELPQRQNYKRTIKQLLRNCYNSHHPKQKKKAKASELKLKTIAGRLIRELLRNVSEDLLKSWI